MTLSPRLLQMGLIGSLALNLFLGGMMLGKVLRPEPKAIKQSTLTSAPPVLVSKPAKPESAAPLESAIAPVASEKTPAKTMLPAKTEPNLKSSERNGHHHGRSLDHGAGDLDGPPLGLRHVIGALDPADQRILRTGLRQVMVQSREDKRQVRRLRQEAARLAAESNFDADTVSAAMARARAAELEGRARSEAILTDTLSKLSPEGRLKVVPVLLLRKRERMEPSGSNTPNGQKEDPGL